MKDQHALQPGAILDKYKIIRLLGSGGFGITYLARSTKLNTEVVIKEYFPNEFAIRSMDSRIIAKSDAESDFLRGLQRFKEEAKILVQFNHKTIVKILDYFEANNTAYFVMRDEGGIDLDKYMQEHQPPFNQQEILEIIIPILEGLKEVHSYNYLHRDIKPGNILLRTNKLPVLIDFGASKLALGEVSKSITSILTEGYAPPEQYSTDVKKQGPFTDLYALAAVMHKMISGVVPPGAQTRIYALLSDKKDPYKLLTDQNLGAYDFHFLHAIDNALSVDAQKRPQTVNEFQANILGESKAPVSKTTQVIREYKIPPQSSSSIFSFEGRINRLKYWFYSLIPIFIFFLGMMPMIATIDNSEVNPYFSLLMLVSIFIAIWISISIQVKRWHDLDLSGWWVITGFIPYVYFVVWIILGFIKGTNGPNRFGQDPVNNTSVDEIDIDNVTNYENHVGVNIESINTVIRNRSSVTLLGMGNNVPSIILIQDEEVTVGRCSVADIKIENKYVSSKHLTLNLDDKNKVYVRDLSSSNGTYIGGRKLEPNKVYELKPNERLLIASEDVVYTL